MDKNKTERDKLYQWACENSTKARMDAIFSSVTKDADSYYEKVENREYIREYEPETAVDIKQELSSLWEKDGCSDEVFEQIKTVCTVACMKNKHLHFYDEEKRQGSYKEQLKPYIYQL